MSYDLYLRHGQGQLFRPMLFAYFADHRNYQPYEHGASYENEDTGVCFSLDMAPQDDEEIEYDLECPVPFAVPGFFAWEIALQLRELTQAMELVVWDPQENDEPTYLPFEAERFFHAWQAHNRAVLPVLQGEAKSGRPYVYPSEKLFQLWGWNYHRAALQEEAGEAVFVPRVMPVTDGKQVATAVVWTDGIPTYLPRTEIVLLVYSERSLPAGLADKERPVVPVEGESVWRLLAHLPQRDRELPYLEMPPEFPDQRVLDFFANPPALDSTWSVLPYESVMDEEFFVADT